MPDIALIALQGADQCLVAARDPPRRPPVIGGQPAQDMLLELCVLCHKPWFLARVREVDQRVLQAA